MLYPYEEDATRTFSLAFFISVELFRSAVYPRYWKACTKLFKNEAEAKISLVVVII